MKKLKIFVHRASECLTDHLSHGEGLICFSLLNGLASRGHQVFAFTNHADIRKKSENLTVFASSHNVRINSLAPFELDLKAEKWRDTLRKEHRFDIEWRMSPFDAGCPFFRPLSSSQAVIGPIYYAWPDSKTSRSRIGILSPFPLLQHFSQKNWDTSLRNAALAICTTEQHSAQIQTKNGCRQMLSLPLIVHAPPLSAQSALPKTKMKLAFVGRLESQKNPQLFLEILATLTQMGQSVEGIIIGDGPLRTELEAQSVALGLNEALTFTGRIPNTKVYERVASCDWLISTAVGEPYGRNIAEAMSMGVPTICHASGGAKDFLRDKIDGLLVEETSAKLYAEKLLACPDREVLAQNARHRALTEWSEEAVLNKLETALYALLEKP
ncbi:glycosyltransferase [Armatimonas sp.]|uniref:glycosyltransferase n=1 Tax=Armatimonas sp. TaxID=1872638 RepID=UPI0037510295